VSQNPVRPCENAPRRPYYLIGIRAGYLTAPEITRLDGDS
jgi:hypothetical protein